MNESTSRQANMNEIDFPLWRLLDHTRYIIFRLREKELAEIGLTPEQAFVLDMLHSAGGETTINRIVEMTQRKHNSMSALVDRMAKQGLLKKRRLRSDKRAYRILSTDKGEGVFQKISRESVYRTFSCFTPDEKAELGDYLNRLLTSAYNSAGMESPYQHPEQRRDSSGNQDTVTRVLAIESEH